MLSSALQEENAELPIDFKLLDKLIFCNAVHPKNALYPILSTVSGRVISFSAVQFAKQLSGIAVILLPSSNVTFVSFVKPAKRLGFKVVTEAMMVIVFAVGSIWYNVVLSLL